jgi:hypothetical protein
MKKRFLAASIVLAAVAGSGLAPLAAQAQNIAVVNGKPVPKSRADAVIAQVQKQAAARGQQLPPDIDKLVRDKVVTDEILVQEAERRGLGASNDFKQQMEIARQSILIGLLAADVDKKAPSATPRSRPSTTSSRRRRAAPSTARATSWSRRKTTPRRSSPSSRPARSSRTWRRRTRRTRARPRTAATSTSPTPAPTCPSSRRR